MSSQTRALEAFAADADLLHLESLLKRFNLFEAVGVVRHELRHSDFLAFLLDPGQSHGLGTAFLVELLQSVRLATQDDSGRRLFDVNGLDLSRAYVLREWHHIDILVVDDINRLAVIIENKIGTGEHSDQLARYHRTISSHYPGYFTVPLYLTPDGEEPTSDDYFALSYSFVCKVIEEMTENSRASLSNEIVMVLEHYAQIIKRHIVSDSDIARLCRSIYQQHKQALDLIIKHIPPQQELIRQYVSFLISQQNELKAGDSGRNYVTFGLYEWRNSVRHGGEHGDNVCWILFFVFNDIAEGLRLDLMIMPGDALEREKHLQMAQKHRFRGYVSKLTGKYSRIASVKFLSAGDYEKSQDEIEAIISEKWAEYMRDEFPRVVQAVREEEWLWELPLGE